MNTLLKSRLALMLVGLILMFVAVRYFGQGEYYTVSLALGAIAFLGAEIGAFIYWKRSPSSDTSNERKIWSYVLTWQTGVILSCLLYFLYTYLLGDNETPETIVQKVGLGFWLLSLILSLSYAIGVELGLKATGSGELSDGHHVSRQANSWLRIGMLVCSLVALNYVVVKKSRGFDLSYLKTTVPGESTQNMVNDLKIPVKMGVFFRRDSDVGPLVRDYLEQIATFSDQIELEFYDKDFAPVKAEEFRVAKNGQIILMADKKRQRIDLGEDISVARSKLIKLDQLFQKSFLTLTAEKKNIYFTQGHGEMTTKGSKVPTRSISQLGKLLRTLNYNVRSLDAVEGGFYQIPDDASLVAIVAPSRSFTENEIGVLQSYLDNGGALLIYLDIEFGGQQRDLLEKEENYLHKLISDRGVQFLELPLVNDQKHVRATMKKIDRTFLVANNFSSHISVKSLAKNDEKMAVLTFQSGSLDQSKVTQGDWKTFKTIQSLPSTFADKNKNLKFDKDEKRQSYAIAMASESEKGKFIVFSDGTVVSNPLLNNAGNQLAVLDSVKWLIGQEELLGEVSSEEDIKIQHSKSRDLFVFHGTIYLVPLLVLIFGFVANYRSKGE